MGQFVNLSKVIIFKDYDYDESWLLVLGQKIKGKIDNNFLQF